MRKSLEETWRYLEAEGGEEVPRHPDGRRFLLELLPRALCSSPSGNGSRALQLRRRSGLFYAIYVLPILLLYLCVFLLNWVLIRTAGSIELRRVQRRLVRRAGRRSASRWRGYVRTRRPDR